MPSDVWAVTPSTSATYYRAAASIAAAGAVSLLTNEAGEHGVGYKVLFTSAGDDSGITFTIVGFKVGRLTDNAVTEVVTGANADTATSSNFYSVVLSITASGASAGDVSIGTTGSLALPRARVKGLYYVGAGDAGSIKLNVNATNGPLLLQVDTPTSAASFADSLFVPADGILTTRSGTEDFAILTLTQVTNVTVFCG